MEAMVVGYGKSVVESTLGKLGSFLLSEALLIGSVREDILFIRDELQSMDAVMSDMIRAGSLSHHSKVWMLHVLQVAYEAELCIEEFNDCLKNPRRHQGLLKAALRAGNFVRTAHPRYLIAKKIQNLKVQAMEVSQRQSRYNIAIPMKVTDITGSAGRAAIIARQDEMHFSSRLMPEDALVHSSSFNDLLTHMKDKYSFKVIVISGPAGFGKTALAKMAYRRRNDPRNYFQKSAWVTLSKSPDINKVLVDILRQVDRCHKGTTQYEGDELTTQLTNELKTSSYLIILDSLWRKEDWGHIRKALPENPKGKIILTTRQKDVVEACRHEGGISIAQTEFTSADKNRLCSLMVLNILNTWWDKILFNWITNGFEEYKWHIIFLLIVIMSVVWGFRLVVHCILHPVMTIIVIGTVMGLRAILRTNITQVLITVSMIVVVPILGMYNLFIWLSKHIAKLFQWGRYLHLISWRNVPMNRVQPYIRLITTERHVLVSVPLAVKFICGALIAKSMDSHKTDELFSNLKSSSEQETDANKKDQHVGQKVEQKDQHAVQAVLQTDQKDQRPKQGGQQQTYQPPEQGAQKAYQTPEEEAQQAYQIPQQEAQQTPPRAPPPKQEVEQTQLAKQSKQEKSKQEKSPNKKLEDYRLKEKKLKDVIKYCHKILEHNPTLKKCAEDLNILPEGYVINRKRLTRRWVNLNFISSARGLSIEQVAESYFDELVVRGFIDVESINSCGNVKSCRINSVFKEYLTDTLKYGQQTSPHDENCIFQLYDIQPFSAPPDCSPKPQSNFSVLKGLKRLKKKLSSPKTSPEPPNVLDFESYKDFTEKQFPPNIIPESLTILDLEGCKGLLTKHLMFLPQCTNLRFLSLRNTDLKEIPEKMGELKNLETLDVRQTPIMKVPNDILALHNLKHLLAGCIDKPENTCDIKGCAGSIEVPVGMEQMSSIQTLAYVDATSSLLLCLRELTQLKKLGLVICDPKVNSKPLCISLMMLFASLLSLSILDERDNNSLGFLEYLCFPPLNLKSLTLKGSLERLPQWIGDHKHLTKLTIVNTRLRSDAIRLIGRIPTLHCLKLYRTSFLEEVLTLEEKEFPVLQSLIIHCDYIRKVIFQKGTTPGLEVIRWVLSKSIAKEIEGISYLPMLKEVSLIGDVDLKVQENIKGAVEKHTNYKTTLVFEKIEKPMTPEGGKKHEAPNAEQQYDAHENEQQPDAPEGEHQPDASQQGRRPEATEGEWRPEAPEGETQPADTPNGAAT